MKIRFEFEIDERRTEDLRPGDFAHCENVGELEDALLEQADPSWRAHINKDDLARFWTEISRERADR